MMGVFKELITERYDEVYFSELDMSLEALERDLEVLDLKLEVIDSECLQMEEELSLLLPSFESHSQRWAHA
jgi:hypothetical protein